VYVTGEPLSVAHIVKASEPIFSDLVPVAVVVADPGNVTGIWTPHLFALAVTVTPVMDLPSAEYVYERLGAQALLGRVSWVARMEMLTPKTYSRVMRLVN
jgi:hypothetical protein